MLTPLLLLSAAAAHATDLDVSVTVPGATHPTAVIFPDIVGDGAPLTSLLVTGDDGREWALTVSPELLEADRIRLDVRLEAIGTDRRGRQSREVVAQPRLITLLGEPATVSMGMRVPVTGEDGETAFVDQGLKIELVAVD